MSELKPEIWSAEMLKLKSDELETLRAQLLALADSMDSKGIAELEIPKSKNFDRGVEFVAEFITTAHAILLREVLK